MYPLQQQILPYQKAKNKALGREFLVSFPDRCMGESGALESITLRSYIYSVCVYIYIYSLTLDLSHQTCEAAAVSEALY